MLLHAVLAAVLGTVAMNLSSTTEMQYRGRPPSTAPGRASNKLLRLVGVPTLEGRALDILSTWTHWLYGAAWGILLWVLVGPLGLPLPAAGVVFFLVVWLTEQVEMPLLGVAPPSWRWGAREVAIDLWHHLTYPARTIVGYVLIGLAAG